jgi:hypothetical protein
MFSDTSFLTARHFQNSLFPENGSQITWTLFNSHYECKFFEAALNTMNEENINRFKPAKDSTLKLQALLDYLNEANIPYSRVSDAAMKDKAVAKFTFDLASPACIVCGKFQDRIKELTSIAHEAGHVMIHRNMNREETRNYVCTMFAANKMGVGRIGVNAQEYILEVEAEASAKGLAILKKIGIHDGELEAAKDMMSKWYASYENQCRKDVVKKVREKITNNKNPALEML